MHILYDIKTEAESLPFCAGIKTYLHNGSYVRFMNYGNEGPIACLSAMMNVITGCTIKDCDVAYVVALFLVGFASLWSLVP